MNAPTSDRTCIALVKPGSALARSWRLGNPAYGIYEYSKAFASHPLTWGDGSWHRLTEAEFADIVLLEELGEPLVDRLFD